MTLPTLGMESREEREERNSRKLDHHNYRFRWAVDIASWNPSEEEFDFLCTELLNEEEGKGCRQFRFEDDRKRALVSKIMQRLAGALVMEGIEGRRKMEGSGNGYIKSMDGNGCMDLKRVEIGKTKGRKPYLVKPGDGTEVVPNFNYSVSHEVRGRVPNWCRMVLYAACLMCGGREGLGHAWCGMSGIREASTGRLWWLLACMDVHQ